MSSDIVALRPGEIFHGRYAVVRRIAAGGMGAVYEVVHQGTQRRCAMKLMLPALVTHPELRARFQTEATIAARIGSEHIVDVFDAGVDEATGAPFLVMELLEGTELGSLIQRGGPIAPSEALTLLRQAALALGKTHAAGIVHRDLKPENMFVTLRDDGSPRLKILDFGIARVVAESGHATKHTGMLGTPAYMAPEQVDAAAPLGPAADVFALGHVAYTMLTGEMYWAEEAVGGAYKLIVKVMGGPQEPPSARARRRRNVSLPAGFDAWFTRAIAHRPEDRFPSVSAQVVALAEMLGEHSASAVPPPPPPPPEPVRSTLHSAPDAPAAQTVPMPPIQVHVATVSAGTTTMPVSSEAVTRRLERPADRPSRRWLLAAVPIAAVAIAIAGWRLAASGGAPAPGATGTPAGSAPSTASTAARSDHPTAATPTKVEPGPSGSATPAATGGASASSPTASTPTSRPQAKPSKSTPASAPSSSKPHALDDGP